MALCAFAGLRLGEAAALQVGDVDFLRRTLTVARQVQHRTGGQVEIRPPKYGSERTVYLPVGLVELLSAHLTAYSPGTGPRRLLFGFGRDVPPHQNTVAFWWRKTRQRAKCGTVKMHDLRHFYASGLIAARCDVVTVPRARPRKRDLHAEHLRALVADSRGPDPCRRGTPSGTIAAAWPPRWITSYRLASPDAEEVGSAPTLPMPDPHHDVPPPAQNPATMLVYCVAETA